MSGDLIPAVDPFPIPGPGWLFHLLLVFTFFLHLLFLNLSLGGTMLAAVAGWRARGGRGGRYLSVAAGRLVAINTYGISLTITTGIAPLLFVQLLYQQFFYTATILIAWAWLLLLVLLMAGYYAVYAYKLRGSGEPGRARVAWLGLAAVLFLVVAGIHVAVHLIHSQPGHWQRLAGRPWSILADPAYLPRLLHFVLAALAFSGLVVAWWAARRARAGGDAALEGAVARFGWRWALVATLLQLVDGFALLFALPREVLLGLMQGGAATLAPLAIAILLALGLLTMLSRVTDPASRPALVGGTLAMMLLAIAVMAVTRHQVRALYLGPVAGGVGLAEAPQWGNFLLFAALLVLGLAAVGWMTRRVLASRTGGPEAA